MAAMLNIPKLAINMNKPEAGLQIPHIQIPSLGVGTGKSRHEKVSSPIIASTPVNELMNVSFVDVDRPSARQSSRHPKEGHRCNRKS